MEINKQVYYNHKLVFYMAKQPDKKSFIALDDITILSHPCQEMINCDFEDGRVCSYSQYTDNTTSKYNLKFLI